MPEPRKALELHGVIFTAVKEPRKIAVQYMWSYWTSNADSTPPNFDFIASHKLPKIDKLNRVHHRVSVQPCTSAKSCRCYVQIDKEWYKGPNHMLGECPLMDYRRLDEQE